jgi:hypothetical protein
MYQRRVRSPGPEHRQIRSTFGTSGLNGTLPCPGELKASVLVLTPRVPKYFSWRGLPPVGQRISSRQRASATELALARRMDDTSSSNQSDLNLATHRAPTSVWDRPGWDGSRERLAVSRILLGVGGGALALQGLRQGTMSGRVLAGLGGTLACLALSGERDLTTARCWVEKFLGPSWRYDDPVLQASAESFPASDPPSWTPTQATTTPRRDRSMY